MSFTNRFGRLPEPMGLRSIEETEGYLEDLVRAIHEVNSTLFAEETGFVFGASRVRPFVEVSTAYGMGEDDAVILADASVSGFVVSLPPALEAKGRTYDIKKIDTNASSEVCVEGSGDEFPLVLFGATNPSTQVFSDGTKFWII